MGFDCGREETDEEKEAAEERISTRTESKEMSSPTSTGKGLARGRKREEMVLPSSSLSTNLPTPVRCSIAPSFHTFCFCVLCRVHITSKHRVSPAETVFIFTCTTFFWRWTWQKNTGFFSRQRLTLYDWMFQKWKDGADMKFLLVSDIRFGQKPGLHRALNYPKNTQKNIIQQRGREREREKLCTRTESTDSKTELLS